MNWPWKRRVVQAQEPPQEPPPLSQSHDWLPREVDAQEMVCGRCGFRIGVQAFMFVYATGGSEALNRLKCEPRREAVPSGVGEEVGGV